MLRNITFGNNIIPSKLNKRAVENNVQKMTFACLETLPLETNIILSSNKTNIIFKEREKNSCE